MKKVRSILTLALAFGFLASVTFTSCGPKKETEETIEQTETEHPAGEEHPTGEEHPAGADTTEHPTEGDTTANPTN